MSGKVGQDHDRFELVFTASYSLIPVFRSIAPQTPERGAVGIALDRSSQKLYWASFFTGQIRVGSLNGGEASTLFSGESPAGIAIDATMQRIYWGNFLTGEIRVGNLDGSLAPVTLVATQNRASFPILLQKPVGEKPPVLSSHQDTIEEDTTKILQCSAGEFALDITEAFLYREPSYKSYTWFRDGRQISGAFSNSIMVREPRYYACAMTGMNAAGAVSLLSNILEVSFAQEEPESPILEETPVCL